MSVFSVVCAQTYDDELYSGKKEESKTSKSLSLKSLSDKDLHLYNAGTYSIKSSKYAYIAIGSTALSGVAAILATDVNNWSKYKIKSGDTTAEIDKKADDSKSIRNSLFVVSGIFGVVSIISTIVSIDLKTKAGNELRLSADPSGAKLSLSF